ncbi:MAG: transcription initiation factor IIB [Thaumarchaeota archaeon]|nr:transcription initiation factor IIB [Nitrososphaerota archaeon]
MKACPVCGNDRFFIYSEGGELVCPVCGYVFRDRMEDEGPEWKAIDLEEREKRARAGSPLTLTIHDFGLSTVIGNRGGRNPEEDARLRRMRRLHARMRTSTSAEKSLANLLIRLSEIGTSLSLPKIVMEAASKTLRIAIMSKGVKSKSIVGMAAGALYLACRRYNTGRTLSEIAKAAGVSKRFVAKYYRLIRKEIEDGHIPPPSIDRYIDKFVNVLKLNPKIEEIALKLFEKTSNSKIFDGKSPAGFAAAYLYIASALVGMKVPQKDLADVAEVTEVTVRNRCKEIMGGFTIRLVPKVEEDHMASDEYKVKMLIKDVKRLMEKAK